MVMAIPLLLAQLLLLAVALAAVQAAPGLHPVVLVPGYATNELDARLTELYRPSSPGCGARKGEGWFRLYLNYSALQDPGNVPCFAEQMSSVYDPAADDYSNVAGVETRVPFFGSTQAFRYPDPDRKNFSYMSTFVERLEKTGYRDGETMFGAPYDFRYAVAPVGRPSRVGDAFFRALKNLVERASGLNGGRPVVIATHSFGGLLAHQFLIRQPLAWRRRFVGRFVPIAAPWGGLVRGMQTLVSGNNLGLPFVDPRALLRQGRSQQSSLWRLPSPAAFGAATPLVTTKSRNYSAGDVADFLVAIGLGEAVGPYESRVLPLFGGELPHPGVPVTTVVGVGVGTPERIVFPGDDFDATPSVVAGDGDGVVNLVSAVAVETSWSHRGVDFSMVKVSNMSHNALLVDDRALEIIIREIQRAD
ncbi:hypothetical protein CFC21_046127 [Triticum aestivum]|uniref:Lecithin-cholesterol acyltransferase-like 1 n=4 Tax=Triticinae TaxID=1648030 RepID=A0A453E3Z3_AEGTS|nr:lecithin-cholesterol acyltransferase-like 1 [Aegilops tauschii subsp. strangulata]XP_044352960.1 lecithin-cholesterol acyltransferase-like 1 [Triticum aestivum]KAF7035210.1 hypothetical protein CFC21_046127 [Triticum aestivum]